MKKDLERLEKHTQLKISELSEGGKMRVVRKKVKGMTLHGEVNNCTRKAHYTCPYCSSHLILRGADDSHAASRKTWHRNAKGNSILTRLETGARYYKLVRHKLNENFGFRNWLGHSDDEISRRVATKSPICLIVREFDLDRVHIKDIYTTVRRKFEIYIRLSLPTCLSPT